MRADRTIIVIGGFLFVIGLAVAWNGYGVIELERGWSMLLAGTIGFCTGLVLVGLGLVLHQLSEIASSASKATLLLAKARNGGLPEIAMPAPAAAPPAPVAPEEDPPLDAKTGDPDWEPEWEPQWELEQALAAETRKIPLASEPVASADHHEIPETSKDRPLAWMIRTDEEDEPVEPKLPAEPEPTVESKPASGDEWLYRAISGPPAGIPEPATEKAEEGEAAPAEIGHEPEFPHVSEAAHISEAAHGLELSHAQPEKADVEPVGPDSEPVGPAAGAENAPPKEVIGHYEAQGAHYTMYADGSIDAETVHGVYRFASMEELKRFIEGQE